MSTGSVFGGALGAGAGLLLGASGVGIAGAALVGGLLGGLSSGQKTVMEYGKLSSRTWQGSEFGGYLPRVYGTYGLTGSQIVWLENNQLKEVVKKKKSGGKGGAASTVTETYSYFATFALMLKQGKSAGIRRIWCSDKLIYNAGSDDIETVIASNKAAKGWTFYDGSDDQLPDPRYEADVGVGNAPAFRGCTYIVFKDFALADYSNTLQAAQFKIELVDQDVEVNLTNVFTQDQTNYPSSAGVWFSGSLDDAYMKITDGSLNLYSHTIYSRFISGSIPAGFTLPLGWTGSSQVYFSTDLKKIYVPGAALDLSGFDASQISYVRGFEIDGAYYVQYAREVCKAKLNEAPVAVSGIDVYTICRGDGVLYGINATHILTFDLDDLSLINSVPFSPYYLPTASGLSSISYSDGVLWYMFYMYDRLEGFDPATGELKSTFVLLDFASEVADGVAMEVVDGIAVFVARPIVTTNTRIRAYRIFSSEIVKPTLASVVQAECELSALITADDLDVSLLTQEVNGYKVAGGDIRSAIEPLQSAYPFDVLPSGYKIKFVPRGQSSVMTIPWEDLAATDGDDIGDSLPYSREMDSQLPQKVSITGISADREYGSSTQYYERLSTSAVNTTDVDVSLVLTDDEIAQMSEKLLYLYWLERDDFDFSLPPTYLVLEPGDVVTVNAKFGTFELRLTEVNYETDGRLTCKAKSNNAAIYTSNAVGAGTTPPSGTVSSSGATIWIPLDIPVVDETLQNSPGFATAVSGFANGWPGAVVVRSPDNGQTYAEIQAYSAPGTFGTARGTLTASPGYLIDSSSLRVDLIAGDLESITRDQMLTGVNYAAYGADGRWEIVRFQNAVLQTDGSFMLSGFVRGDRGTEWATGLHAAGDYFVLLDDPDNIFIDMATGSLAVPMLYRAVTTGNAIDSASDQAFTYQGVNLKPLSPVSVSGSRNTSGDLAVSFYRRTRLSTSWWTNGVAGVVGETAESYSVDVMSGATVKRTITSTTNSFAYSAADQVTDFGSVQASITLRIYQISSVIGRGYVREVTL